MKVPCLFRSGHDWVRYQAVDNRPRRTCLRCRKHQKGYPDECGYVLTWMTLEFTDQENRAQHLRYKDK